MYMCSPWKLDEYIPNLTVEYKKGKENGTKTSRWKQHIQNERSIIKIQEK